MKIASNDDCETLVEGEKVLGTMKTGPKFRIALTNYVREKLKAKIGDLIVYVEDDRGNIVLRRSKLN